ncbi:hypothetical protein APSETT444_007602 [Aspergillus pseudonomiae]
MDLSRYVNQGQPRQNHLFNNRIVEGLITIFAGIIFTLLVPPKAGNGYALIGLKRWSYFTPRESHIIRNRVLLDDPRKARGHIKITAKDIWNTVRQPNTIQHFFITLVAMSGFQGLTQYTPSMIKSFGFSAVRANALASVDRNGGQLRRYLRIADLPHIR